MKPIYAMIAFCTLFLLLSTLVIAQQPAATVDQGIKVPNLIKFTGTLKYPNGLPRVGSVEINFGLYPSQEGGEALWNETQLVQTDAEGNYSVYLGASEKTGLPVDLFSSQKARWLGAQIQNEEEQSRVLLVAVPYALKAADADTVGGKPISSFVLYEDLANAGQNGSSATVPGAQGMAGTAGELGSVATNSSSAGAGRSDSLGSSRGTSHPLGLEGGSPYYITLYGSTAGASLTTGSYNSFLGYGAGYSNTSGGNNAFVGSRAGYFNTMGILNSFFGDQAGYSNTSGSGNSFHGQGAGFSNTTGSNNSFFGVDAGLENTTGILNSFFGDQAGASNLTGNSNSFVGTDSGFSNTTGIYNSFFGSNSGLSNTIENKNTFIGYSSNGAAGITNSTAVGANASVTQSNSLVLGGVNGINGATAETNVGIGVTAPDRNLTVEGTQAIGRFRRFYGTSDPFTATYGPAFLFERARGTRASAADIQAGDYLGKLQFQARVSGNYPAYGAFAFIATDTAQNGRFAFLDRDLTTERVSILNTGKVGIGTSTPTEALQVIGNIKVSGSILYGSSADDEIPDYVFEPGYKLMTVEELGSFITKEKHLPKIPSAAEIKEKGLNLTEIQMRLLEKIEELTLYTVQQAKEIALKDAEISALKSDFGARLAALEQLLKKGEEVR